MPRAVLAATLVAAIALASASASAAASDPSSNFAFDSSCSSAAVCLQKAISYLDQARARLGQPAYRLPSDFAQLPPDEQAFVLTNLDRLVYGLAPIPGLTAQLDQAAAAGVRSDTDPLLSGPTIGALASNWGAGYPNMPLVYGAWMYDDGPGGANLDCVRAGASGCWAHRDNILWRFTGRGPLAMGAAAGTDLHGTKGFAMLLVQGAAGFSPTDIYTWSQAVAAGAGAGPATVNHARPAAGRTGGLRISRLRVRGHTISFHLITGAGTRPACSLVRQSSRGDRYRRCGPVVTYRRVRLGTYRLRVRVGPTLVTRRLRIR